MQKSWPDKKLSPANSRGLIEAKCSSSHHIAISELSPANSRGLIEAVLVDDLSSDDLELSPANSRGLIEAVIGKYSRIAIFPIIPGKQPGPH